MDTGEIKKLIEAFYNGNTTAEEEQTLLDYFKGENVAEELLNEKKIFLEMNETDNIEIPVGLEDKLSNLIDKLATEEEEASKPRKKSLWTWAGSVAAGVAILIFAGIHFTKQHETVMPIVTQVNAEDQYKIEEAQKALLLISSNFNKGVDQLSVVSTSLDKTNEILNKTLGQLNN